MSRSRPSGGQALFLAKLLFGILIIAVLAWSVDLGAVWDLLVRVAAWALIASIAAFAVSVLLHTWRWRRVLASRQIELGLWETVRLILCGNFFSLFLPGSLGGDVYRVLGAQKAAASLLQSTGTVLIERYCGFLATFLMALGAMLVTDFARRQPGIALFVLLMFCTFVFLVAMGTSRSLAAAAEALFRRLRFPRAVEYTTRISTALRAFVQSPGLIVELIALSVAMKLCSALVIWFLARGLSLPMRWDELAVFLPIYMVMSALPVSVNGLGVREASLVGFYMQMGLTAEQATSLAFLLLIWVYGTAIPGGLLLLWRRHRSG